MNEDAVVSLVLSVVLAVVMASAGFGGRNGTLPIGSFLGIRTKATRHSKETWDAAHLAAAPFNLVAAAIFALSGLVAALLVDGEDAAATVIMIGWGTAMVAVGIAVYVARKAAQELVDA